MVDGNDVSSSTSENNEKAFTGNDSVVNVTQMRIN